MFGISYEPANTLMASYILGPGKLISVKDGIKVLLDVDILRYCGIGFI